jgi:lysophospholipase L1-like esterase
MRRGVARAEDVLERRRGLRPQRAADAGHLIAEGDSWFDYPFDDVLEELERYGYTVESVAHMGDTVEEMAYDDPQLNKLARAFEKLAAQQKTPKAILLSGGGNDIAGDELAVLLNHKKSGLPTLSERVVSGVIDERLRTAIISLASAVTHLAKEHFGEVVPVLMHGYDYPVPDGRGYAGGFWLLPGPWLEPGFRLKGYLDMRERLDVMQQLIDRFNRVVHGVAAGPGLEHVRHVDLRGTLSNALTGDAYKTWWANELHPTDKGYQLIAQRFQEVLGRL